MRFIDQASCTCLGQAFDQRQQPFGKLEARCIKWLWGMNGHEDNPLGSMVTHIAFEVSVSEVEDLMNPT